MPSLTPYLFYGGRAQEALEYYRSALGAETSMVMRFNESPEPVPEGMLAPEWGDKVMHAGITVGGQPLFLSDGMRPGSTFDSVMLALEVEDEGQARRYFDALAADGQVVMPLGPTFWSPLYGMVTDKFGVGWMIMLPGGQA